MKKSLKTSFLKPIKILLLVICSYSTYDIVGYWNAVSKKNLLHETPFPMKEIGVLSGVTLLLILLWLLYFYISAPTEKEKWETSHKYWLMRCFF